MAVSAKGIAGNSGASRSKSSRKFGRLGVGAGVIAAIGLTATLCIGESSESEAPSLESSPATTPLPPSVLAGRGAWRDIGRYGVVVDPVRAAKVEPGAPAKRVVRDVGPSVSASAPGVGEAGGAAAGISPPGVAPSGSTRVSAFGAQDGFARATEAEIPRRPGLRVPLKRSGAGSTHKSETVAGTPPAPIAQARSSPEASEIARRSATAVAIDPVAALLERGGSEPTAATAPAAGGDVIVHTDVRSADAPWPEDAALISYPSVRRPSGVSPTTTASITRVVEPATPAPAAIKRDDATPVAPRRSAETAHAPAPIVLPAAVAPHRRTSAAVARLRAIQKAARANRLTSSQWEIAPSIDLNSRLARYNWDIRSVP